MRWGRGAWGIEEYEERLEDSDSSQKVREHLVAYHLAPAITDFILDENLECCYNELEQTLTLLHSELEQRGRVCKAELNTSPIDSK